MIADLKPYAEYKESGLPWVGEIPEHWASERAKWLFTKMNRPVREEDEVVTCFRDGMVTLRKNRRLRGFTEATVYFGYQGIRKGDLVIHGMDAFAGAIGVSDSDGKGTPVYNVCQPRLGVSASYYAHLVRQMSQSEWILALAKGIRERSTDFRFEMFGNQRVPLPPPDEQVAIVRFLDWANGRLERAIRAKRKVIALLDEQKQAIIHRAVTRGLDPSVPLKPSGIPWLGDIPQHWEVRRLKTVLARNDGGVWGSDFAPDGTIVLRSTEQAMDGSWQIDEPAVIRLSESQVQSALLEVGDIVVTKSSGSPSHIGKASLVTREIAEMGCCYSNFMQRLRTAPDLAPEYLSLFLNSKTGRMHYQYSSTSTTGLGNITRETIATLPIPVPDRSEQARVLDGARQRLKPIDEATSRLAREIDLLREYRTRLVADVVTGKLDVRKAAERLSDEAPLDTAVDDADLVDEAEAADEEAAV